MTVKQTDKWITGQLFSIPGSEPEVLEFIQHFRERSKDIPSVFTTGYCYYFAIMLQDAFGGDLYLVPRLTHVVWSRNGSVFYDINGVCNGIFAKNEAKKKTKEELKRFRKIPEKRKSG